MAAADLRLILTKLQALTADYNWLRESGGIWAGEKHSSVTHNNMYWGQTHFWQIHLTFFIHFWFQVAKMLKEIPRGSTFVIRLVEPLKAGFGNFLSFLLLIFLFF